MSNPQNPHGGAPAPGQDPGRTLGIVGLVTAIFCAGLPGIIISAIALRKSKAAGFKNGLALAGLIVGIVVLLIAIGAGIALGLLGAAGVEQLQQVCAERGPGTHVVDGITYNCP